MVIGPVLPVLATVAAEVVSIVLPVTTKILSVALPVAAKVLPIVLSVSAQILSVAAEVVAAAESVLKIVAPRNSVGDAIATRAAVPRPRATFAESGKGRGPAVGTGPADRSLTAARPDMVGKAGAGSEARSGGGTDARGRA